MLIINGVLAALFVSSPMVDADTKYPAADFQPQVVFQDDDYIEKSGKYEAASTGGNEVDAKYPAAHFQPQVVYSDPNYKHTDSTISISKTKVASEVVETETVATSDSKAANAEKSDSTLYMILLVAAAALAGVYFFKNQSKAGEKTTASESSAAAKAPGVTGVARYINKKAGTGVSRYLDKQVKTAATATGVAKYVAKQALSAKTKATEAATGVEKYMRNRG